MAQQRPRTPREQIEHVDRRMAQVDGVNGAAGHALEDRELRTLLRRQIAGEITGERYRQLGMARLDEGGGS